jgi:hypothetical protein
MDDARGRRGRSTEEMLVAGNEHTDDDDGDE